MSYNNPPPDYVLYQKMDQLIWAIHGMQGSLYGMGQSLAKLVEKVSTVVDLLHNPSHNTQDEEVRRHSEGRRSRLDPLGLPEVCVEHPDDAGYTSSS